jgi:hypothetical protein
MTNVTMAYFYLLSLLLNCCFIEYDDKLIYLTVSANGVAEVTVIDVGYPESFALDWHKNVLAQK